MRTLADYLKEKGLDASRVIVEYRGEIYAPGSDLSSVDYVEGEAVEVFRVVAGG